MPSIQITEAFDYSPELKIRNDSHLANAGMNKLVTAVQGVFTGCDRPVDKADERALALGGSFISQDLLSHDRSPRTVILGISGERALYEPADTLLSEDACTGLAPDPERP